MPYKYAEYNLSDAFEFCVEQLQDGAQFLPIPVTDLDVVFCGCGDPESSWQWIADYLLRLANGQWNELNPTEQIVAYLLDHLQFTEHGTSVRCCWLTDKGMVLLGFLCRWGSGWKGSIDRIWWVDIEGVTRSLVG